MIPRPTRLFASACAVTLLLAGCAGGGDSDQAPPTDDITANTIVAEVELPGYGDEESVTAAVRPLTRTGETATLTFDLRSKGSADVVTRSRFSAAASPTIPAPGTIRLFDSAAGQMLTPALASNGEILSNQGWHTATPDGSTVQIVYAAPQSETVAVMIPGSSMIRDVPVIDGRPRRLPSTPRGAISPRRSTCPGRHRRCPGIPWAPSLANSTVPSI